MEKLIENGHEIKILDKEEIEEVKRYYKYLEEGAVRVYPENILLPQIYSQLADKFYTYKFRPGDVLCQGYPKTGTTWLQEIVWTMLNNPNFDNPRAKLELLVRSPIFEPQLYTTVDVLKAIPSLYRDMKATFPHLPFEESVHGFEVLDATPDYRVMKCHLPISLLDPNALDTVKCIYTMRDPRDLCISFYQMSKALGHFQFKGSLEEFAEGVLADKVLFGNPANHMKLWQPYKDHKHVLLIFYEDLKMEPMVQLKRLDKFLGANLSQQQLEKIKHHISFDQMKKQASWATDANTDLYHNNETQEDTYMFYRKGMVGEYKERFSAEMIQKFEKYLQKELGGLGFPYC